MKLTIKIIEKREDISDSDYSLINKTMERYLGINYTKNRILRLALSWVGRESCPSYFILSNGKEAFLLNFYREGFFDYSDNNKYVIDYADRLTFYHKNLWDISELLIEFKSLMKFKEKEGISSFVVENKDYKNLKEFVSTVKCNYNSHFFGVKSKRYNSELISADSYDANIRDSMYFIIECLEKYGWERYKYFTDNEESWIEPELYDIIFNFKSYYDMLTYNYKNSYSGLTKVTNDRCKPIGFLTWYVIGDTAFLEELHIDKSDEYKPLSLYRVITIDTIYKLFKRGVKRVLMGFCTNDSLTDYKTAITTDKIPIKFYESQYKTIEDGFNDIKGVF